MTPTEPTPTDPAPTEPAPTEPAPTEPTPVEPEASTEPGPGAERVRRAARVRTVLAQATSAVVVLAAVGAVVAVDQVLPTREPADVPLQQVTVPTADSMLVCPGAVRLPTEPEPGGDVAYDPQFDPAPGDAQSTLQAVTVDGAVTDLETLAPADDEAPEALGELQPVGGTAALAVDDVEPGAVLRSVPEDSEAGQPAWAAGATGFRAQEGDLRGLAGASCQRPATESWLVGGSTSLGSSARLVLQNPGRTAASVEVRLWGPAGPVELAGAPEYLVPPGAERVVLLEGVAAEQSRIVVQTRAAGGSVTAYLQDSELRGLVPAGVDLVVSGQRPSQTQVVPGLAVTSTESGTADTARLRLLVPGESGTTAQVTLLGPDGPVDLPGTAEVELSAGSVLDVPLGGLPAGTYTAVVEASEPVVAGALLTRGAGVGEAEPTGSTGPSDPPLDRAWAPSVATGAGGPVAVPLAVGGRLVVAAAPDEEASGRVQATLDVIGADGRVLGQREVSLAEGTSRTLPLDGLLEEGTGTTPAAVVLRSADPRVAWSVVLLSAEPAGAMVSVLAPVPPEVQRPEVGVLVR